MNVKENKFLFAVAPMTNDKESPASNLRNIPAATPMTSTNGVVCVALKSR